MNIEFTHQIATKSKKKKKKNKAVHIIKLRVKRETVSVLGELGSAGVRQLERRNEGAGGAIVVKTWKIHFEQTH